MGVDRLRRNEDPHGWCERQHEATVAIRRRRTSGSKWGSTSIRSSPTHTAYLACTRGASDRDSGGPRVMHPR
jgi:hypothetical protein